MADLVGCKLCQYVTVRCGMTNHLKTKHPKEYQQFLQMFYSASKDARLQEPEELIYFIKKVSHFSKNREQILASLDKDV